MIKKPIKALFNSLGLEISRKQRQSTQASGKYFNTGQLSPLQENSVELYDKFYSDQACLDEYYKGLRLKFYRAVIEQLVAEGVSLDERRVLDVGCGVGFLLAQVLKTFRPRSLSGTDFSEEAMKVSRKRFPTIEFFQHDVNCSLKEKYDAIFCTEVLEHLEKPFVALKNLTEALDLGGVLVLTVPDGRIDTNNEHINFWSPESWKVFLERECPDARVSTCKLLGGPYNFGLLIFS